MDGTMMPIPKKDYDELMEIAVNAQAFIRYANGTKYIEKDMASIFFPEIQVKESND